ncbi:MAG: hypothetical protein IJY93_00065 [Clostridia bacterium]|nr:hypothetical protein [Clostridia bacterium]
MKGQKKGDKQKLEMWQRRLQAAEDAYSAELASMDRRERAYRGEVEFDELVKNEATKAEDIKHIRNAIGELIEAQVDSTLTQPKVTALHPHDEALAKLAEDALRNEVEQLSVRQTNDLIQRIVPVQGGVFYLVEWDNTKRTHTTVGELKLMPLHPKQVIPQDGVFTSVSDMDYIFIKLPQTKEYVRRKYGVRFDNDSVFEEEPDVRGIDGETQSDDLCTQYLAYYRSDSGTIGLFSWVHDTVICDYDDYQARKEKVCADCGEPEPKENGEDSGKVCPKCGGTEFTHGDTEYEVITEPFETADGTVEASRMNPIRVRYYKPDVYPIVLQRNVSCFGQLLGSSDVDMIYSQQQTLNRTEKAIIDKLLTGGTLVTLPPSAEISEDNRIGKCVHLKDISEKQYLGHYDLTADIEPDAVFAAQVYEEMRQMIGITDSFQGREDSTATSAVAKQFAARQSAGRLESKREMKAAAWSELFEIMFKFKLAYTDEARPVRSHDESGKPIYEVFDRHKYIKRDAAGEYYYDDEFLFSVDASASLASNREAMWQETRMNLTQGAFGDPSSLETLILFWQKMELLHYPGAAETKHILETKLESQMQQQQQQAQMQAEQAQMEQAMAERQAQADEVHRREETERAAAEKQRAAEEAEIRRVEEMARKDAMRDAVEMRRMKEAQAAQMMTSPAPTGAMM